MSMSVCAGWFKEYMISVPMTQEVEIQNPRLGYLHKVLVLGTIFLACSNMWYNGLWYRNFRAEELALEFWGTAPPSPRAASAYCANSSLQDYAFVYDPTYSYAPTACVDLPQGEMFSKRGGGMEFLTYSKDQYVWSSRGEERCRQEEIACNGRGGAFQPVQRQGGSCRCIFEEEFLSNDVESSIFWLNHGYKVDMDEWGDSYQTQRSTEPYGHLHQRGEEPQRLNRGPVMTIVRRDGDGGVCNIGGRSRWLGETVHGTLEEWLACGGLNLDERNAVLRGSGSGPAGPAGRISGVSLQLHLTYSNYANTFVYSGIRGHEYDGVVCTLVVKAVPVWNSFVSMAYTQMVPHTIGNDVHESSAYRYRYAQGVTISVEVAGMFGFLDWPLMFTSIMSSFVLLAIPKRVAKLIALYCVGATSKVYRQAQRSRFNIHDAVHGFSARLLAHAETYRSLETGIDQRGISRPDLENRMVEVLGHRHHGRQVFLKQRPPLDVKDYDDFREEDVASILSCLTDGGDKVTIEEYIHAASGNEAVHVGDIVTFFDLSRSRSYMERIFEASEIEKYRRYAQTRIDSEASFSMLEAKVDSGIRSGVAETKDNSEVIAVPEGCPPRKREECPDGDLEKEKSARQPGGGLVERLDIDSAIAKAVQKEVKAALAEVLAGGELLKAVLDARPRQDRSGRESGLPRNVAPANEARPRSPRSTARPAPRGSGKGQNKIVGTLDRPSDGRSATCEIPILHDGPLEARPVHEGHPASEGDWPLAEVLREKSPSNKIPSGFPSPAATSRECTTSQLPTGPSVTPMMISREGSRDADGRWQRRPSPDRQREALQVAAIALAKVEGRLGKGTVSRDIPQTPQSSQQEENLFI